MRYLSGCVYAPVLHWQYGGIMFTPEMGNKPDLTGVTWAADNGCYTSKDKFSPEKWVKFLRRWQGQGTCVLALAPDVPFNMDATLLRSVPFFPIIRELGYPVGLAIQNGVQVKTLEWDTFDAVFIAGTKAFKTSWQAYEVIKEAKKHKKYVHIARRNSQRAVQEAYDMGADSVDGTYLAFGPDKNWPKMQAWFEQFCRHDTVNYWDDKKVFGICTTCHRNVWSKVK
jgi:hypothetical protein